MYETSYWLLYYELGKIEVEMSPKNKWFTPKTYRICKYRPIKVECTAGDGLTAPCHSLVNNIRCKPNEINKEKKKLEKSSNDKRSVKT